MCFSPHWQVGSSWFRKKIVSSEQEQRLSRWADFAKNCLPRIECKDLPRFREKYGALGHHVCKIREIGGKKNGVQHVTAIYPIPRYTRPRYIGLTLYSFNRGWHEIWEALVLRTSKMVSTLVQNQMSTCLRWIKLIYALIICLSIGRVTSDSHLSEKPKIAFRTIGHLFPRPLFNTHTSTT